MAVKSSAEPCRGNRETEEIVLRQLSQSSSVANFDNLIDSNPESFVRTLLNRIPKVCNT